MQRMETMKQLQAYHYKAQRLAHHLHTKAKTPKPALTASLGFFSLSSFFRPPVFSLPMAGNFIDLRKGPLNKPPFEIIARKTKTINVKYKDCLRNHAPQLGVNVVDGCGEFAPKGRGSEARRGDDLDCEACGCHRNFHRKEFKKQIILTFIESEQANWSRSNPPASEGNNNEEKPAENGGN